MKEKAKKQAKEEQEVRKFKIFGEKLKRRKKTGKEKLLQDLINKLKA